MLTISEGYHFDDGYRAQDPRWEAHHPSFLPTQSTDTPFYGISRVISCDKIARLS